MVCDWKGLYLRMWEVCREMVEIKEEDIEQLDYQDGFGHCISIRQIESFEQSKQLKQQILQDHEDAKKWDTLMTHTKYHNAFGCQYHFDLKEERRRNQFLQSENQELKKENNELGSQLQDTAKDRQIVKRLEEQAKYFTLELASIGKPKREGDCYYETHFHINRILQKILGRKK